MGPVWYEYAYLQFKPKFKSGDIEVIKIKTVLFTLFLFPLCIVTYLVNLYFHVIASIPKMGSARQPILFFLNSLIN